MSDRINQERPNRHHFNTTRWSVVLRARDLSAAGMLDAWNELAQTYWYPLYAYCRRQNTSDQDAQDLTQGFFAHLLAGPRLESISPEKGRFRTFLLTAFKNFVANHYRDASRQIRGGGKTIVPLDQVEAEARYGRTNSDSETPEQAFERDWAESLLERVKKRLAEHYVRTDKVELFSVLQSSLVPGAESASHAEIAERFNLSISAIGMAIVRMRRRYKQILLEEVAATVDDSTEVEDELRRLMAVFRDEK